MLPPPNSDVPRRLVWGVILTLVTVVSTFAFACGTPFAALGALGALFLPRRDAVLLIGANWLANQAIGFALMHFPHTWECYLGGASLAVAAGVCTIVAMIINNVFPKMGATLAALVSFAAAFVSYEGVLFLVSPSASAPDFAFAIVAYIFCINAIAFAGLLLLKTVVSRFGYAFPLIESPAAASEA